MLPTKPVTSEIINYDQLAVLWGFLQSEVRIRIPQTIFQSTEHGGNLQTLYRKCSEYSESYEHAILLVKTTDNAVFGAYLDVMPQFKQDKFQGTPASFVFSLSPSVQKYTCVGEKARVGLFDKDYLCVGFDGKGPAIRVDDLLKTGRTYESETFRNQPLGIENGNDFCVACMEVIKI